MDAHAGWIISRVELDALHAIADRIDKKHAEAVADALQLRGGPDRWVKLPVDADGVPIHVGDVVEYDGISEKVTTLSLWSSGWNIGTEYGDFDNRRVKGYELELLDHPELFRHAKPDSWEDIIADALKFAGNGGVPTGARFADYTEEFVERCRRLAGERG